MLATKIKTSITGIFLCIITAIIAIFLSELAGVNLLGFNKSPLSPIIFAIIIGLLINSFTLNTAKFDNGIKFCIKYLLKLGIIFLGIRLSLLDFLLYFLKLQFYLML